MGLKLVRLLAGAVLLIEVSGTAMGGECEDMLQRMEGILGSKGHVAAGSVPEFLKAMPKGVSIYESEDGPKTIDSKIKGIKHCFKLSGEWSKHQIDNKPVTKQNGHDNFPRINAYVFFKSPMVDEVFKELSVGVVYSDKRFIALNVTAMVDGKISDNIFAGSKGKPLKDKEQEFVSHFKENIIWLDRDAKQQGYVNVVLCEGPCRNMSNFYTRKENANRKDEVTPTPVTMAVITDLQAEIAELQKNFSAQREVIRKNAIADFMDSETVFKFVDKGGNELGLNRKDLIAQECTLPEIEQLLTQKGPSTFIYNNCISVNTQTRYKIVKSKIQQSGKTLAVTFTLKKTKPVKISEIKVIVEMADLSKVTNACTLQAMIVDTSTNNKVSEEIIFSSTSSRPIQHTFHKKLKEPIAWKDKTLILRKLEGADCQPKGGEFRITLTPKEITNNGVLRLQSTIKLHSTLGKALLVLNTMIGEKSVNNGPSTTELYPIIDDEDTRELYTEIVTQTLKELKGKAKVLTIGFRKLEGKVELKDFSNDFEILPAEELARKIVGEAQFMDGEFVWKSMLGKIKRDPMYDESGFAYQIFIGQSGLSNDKSYCNNRSRKDALDENNIATFIYDFSTTDNDHTPKVSELENNTKNFPHKRCDNKYRHIVLFPGAKKPKWEKVISSLLEQAFESVSQ